MQARCSRTRHVHAQIESSSLSTAQGHRPPQLPQHTQHSSHGRSQALKQSVAQAVILLALACVCVLNLTRIWDTAALNSVYSAGPGCSSSHASAVQALRGSPLTAHVNGYRLNGERTPPISKPSLITVGTAQGAHAASGPCKDFLQCVWASDMTASPCAFCSRSHLLC